MNSIKDLIYFDISKAKSIISQLNDGLINEISRAVEDENEENAGIGFDVKIIKGNLGEKSKEKTIRTEKISLFHEMLNSIEKDLYENDLLISINSAFDNWEGSFNDFMDEIPKLSYVKATGWGVLRILKDLNEYSQISMKFKD